jgi:hypothetical protein
MSKELLEAEKALAEKKAAHISISCVALKEGKKLPTLCA